MKTAVYRRATFNAAHRLYNPKWDDAKNDRIFGLCNNPNFHGHNYTLIVKITGEVDEETGYLIDLKKLKELIQNEVTDKLDHSNLNLDIAEFKNLNPTAENIAKVIHDTLREKIDLKFDLQIRLYETENNFVEYPA